MTEPLSLVLNVIINFKQIYWLTLSFLFISSFDNFSATWKDSELTLVSLLRQGKPSLGTYASRFALKKKKKIKPRSWEAAPGVACQENSGALQGPGD